MTPNRLNLPSGFVRGTAATTLLFLILVISGCGQPKATNRADEEKKFLAPTNVSQLRPEAREALRHMPGGDKAQPPGSTTGAAK